ncbi:hypothetical protein BpHYR1_021965, partial [Brachionus plicatilis]
TIPKLNWNNINVQIEYQTILEKKLKELKFIDKLKSVNENNSEMLLTEILNNKLLVDKEIKDLHIKMRYFLKLYKNNQYSYFNYKMFNKRFRSEQRKRIKTKNDKKAWMLNLSYKDKNKFSKLKGLTCDILEASFKKLFNNKIIKENQQHEEYLNMVKREVLDYEKNIKDNKEPYELQEALNICEKYGIQQEIKFNPIKTQFIVFGDKMKLGDHKPRMYNQEIEHVDKLRYLGVLLNRNNNNKDQVESRIKAAFRSFSCLRN